MENVSRKKPQVLREEFHNIRASALSLKEKVDKHTKDMKIIKEKGRLLSEKAAALKAKVAFLNHQLESLK